MSDSTLPSPSLKNCEYGCVLLLGGSGTGKSYGLKQMISSLQETQPKKSIPHLYSINVRDREYLTEFAHHTPTTFDKLKSIKENSIVIVEDIISLTAKEEVNLRQLLNWRAHHTKLKVFCVSHNIFKTKLYNTIAYFQFVVFTSSLSNLTVIKNCLNYFQLAPQVWDELQIKIKNFAGKQGIYFFFDTNKRALYVTNDLTDPASTRLLGLAEKIGDPLADKNPAKLRQQLQNRFELFFKGRDNATQANALFSILVTCLDPSHVRLEDLTLNFNSKNGVQGASLVDYVNAVLDANPKSKPDQAQNVVHNYLKQKCKIPKIFVLNKYFD